MTAAWTGRQTATATVTLMGAMLAGGAVFFSTQQRRVTQAVEHDMEAIADLKVGAISRWRQERLADGAMLAGDVQVGAAVARVAGSQGASPSDDVAFLRARLGALLAGSSYEDISVVDTSGAPLLALRGAYERVHPEVRAAVSEARRTGRPAIADLHTGEHDDAPHLAVVVPVDGEAGGEEAVAFIVLVSLARDFLYPLVQSWPVARRTAETLLVRRDGDDVLFLNDVRHQAGAALRLRIPLAFGEVPAVRAVQGFEGPVWGRDYRGVKVVAFTRRVPDSPWYLVAKIDAAEALGPWLLPSVLIVALTVCGVAAAGAGGYASWQRRLKGAYRARYEAEAARRAVERRLDVTLRSIGDAVISADAEGRAELMNPVAEGLTGWSQEEARGNPLDEVFHIVNEETRQPVESPVTRVLREGTVVGLGNHTLLIGRDGREVPIADSGAPIRGDGGVTEGVVLVFRDQTQERQARRALEASEARYRLLAEATRDIIVLHDEEGNILYVNEAGLRMTGFTREEAMGASILRFLTPESADQAAQRRLRRASGERGPLVYEAEFVNREGHTVPVEAVSCPVETDGGKDAVLVVARDITARRRIEEERAHALREAFRRSAEMSALLAATKAVLGHEDFATEARVVFDTCRNLLGATAGYVALLSPDGTRNEVLFLESGGIPCTVDPSLPMPIRGLREVASRERRVVYENDFASSEWASLMPQGHAPLRNVLFAPLLVDGEAVGLLGLANKPQPFDERDARMAAAFAEVAALALRDARAMEAQRMAEESLRAALAEKEVLLREVHHRVKNNLQAVISLVELRREELPDEARSCLDELREQARTMALVYEQLYQSEDLAHVEMQPYLEAITVHAVQVFGRGRPIRATVEAPLRLGVGVAMPCGLIVNELVANALKHAFGPGAGGHIRVNLLRDRQELALEVTDDGRGIAPSVEIENPATMGLRLVRLWAVHQLGGTIRFTREGGTTCSVRFRYEDDTV